VFDSVAIWSNQKEHELKYHNKQTHKIKQPQHNQIFKTTKQKPK